ncbi:YwbE family protein [Heyndrickxia acidicola]|uniref:YwbE family protein n=1 Tax=Heyndrickxia acidicola TaxID=209389 RepID=A0ABU6ML68_9BACI|nr:YwbE family protein [Heyndrickxia acidicola]MED1205426.1 YwbE family protein [Heyndrickxia acidicola]
MNGNNRKDITPGISVEIVLKADQKTGNLTKGIVKDILTNSATHPHGIKVRLTDGQIGRVQKIYPK